MRITNDAKQATRRRILDAARRLFGRDGFDGAATRDLAREAGIAAGTLFNYFPTKEAVAMSLTAEALDEARVSYERKRRDEESLEEDLFAFIAAGLRSLKPVRGCLRPVLEGALSPLADASEGESLRTGHLETVGAILTRHGQEEPAAPIMHLYWTLYTGVLAFWLGDASPHQEDTLAVLDQALKMFVHSLPPANQSTPSTPKETSHESQPRGAARRSADG
ncbi:MAG TPA: TetR/AcrR family transcriptional regulator [Gemmataceae bacterium]|nr:TetR/AcrR family transcriptional regulator [Gemmataceae bacterium]